MPKTLQEMCGLCKHETPCPHSRLDKLMNNPEDNQWAKSYFEANVLDGDKLEDCGKTTLSAEYVWEVIEEMLSIQAEKQREELSKYTAHHLDCDWQEDNECDCGLVNILYPREDLTNNHD